MMERFDEFKKMAWNYGITLAELDLCHELMGEAVVIEDGEIVGMVKEERAW